MTRLDRLVAVVAAVSATRSRTAKTQALAALLGETPPEQAAATVGLLLGRPRQGRIGIGWRGLLAAREASPPAAEARLTVADVDATLERYAATSGPGSAAARGDLLAGLFARATAPEQDLLIRSLGGEVRTGALDSLVTDALARAIDRPLEEVRRAVMLSGTLTGTVEQGLRDPASLAAVGLRVGIAVQPMLASPAAGLDAAVEALGEASIEHKLDGARIQVHRDGSDVAVFTRSLADVTARVPEIVEAVRALPCRTCILDGETLMLDEAGAPRPFQETMSRFGADAARSGLLAPRFFDLLHLDGADLLDAPLRERRAALRTLAPAHLIEGAVTADPEAAARILAEALAAGHEGIVAKDIESPYAAGRRGKSWLKVKPVHTYDLVVLAAEWGSGRRQGWLSNLHLGARDPAGVAGEPGGFAMVGKTFKGLTDELLRWQTETFPAYEVRRTRGTVYLRPELVVEIALDGVQRSSRYAGGLALRFARVRRYRPDKSPAEADTLAELRTLLPVSP